MQCQCNPGLFSIGVACACFSGRTQVETQDRGLIRMKELRIGDHVRAANGQFERVYSFGHLNHDKFFTYLVFNRHLEISPNHLIGVEGRGYVPSSTLEVGDWLFSTTSDGKLRRVQVTDISSRTSKGAYAPFTPSGSIVVNHVVASSYISLQTGSSDFIVQVGPKFRISTVWSWHWLSHVFEFPHRLFCNYYNWEICLREDYTNEGISTWVQIHFNVVVWWFQNPSSPVSITVSLILLPIVGVSWLWCGVLEHRFLAFLCGLIIFIVGFSLTPHAVMSEDCGSLVDYLQAINYQEGKIFMIDEKNPRAHSILELGDLCFRSCLLLGTLYLCSCTHNSATRVISMDFINLEKSVDSLIEESIK